MKIIKSILTIWFASLSVLIAQESDDSNVMPGQLSVSPSGAATYEVPLELPQGIKDITPNLAFVYNSQSGNGLAGWGWNVSGISSIARTPSTIFHDGVSDPVDFDDLDRFTLNGQRLIAVSGTYGANGTEYRTANFSNLKIISYGTSSFGAKYGPQYFTVIYPDGSQEWYGQTLDSNGRLEWGINKWLDINGNSISYTYENDHGIILISSIEYGSKSGTVAPNTIIFNYRSRKRGVSTYVAGESFYQNEILSSIEINISNVLYRTYTIGKYTNSIGYQTVGSIGVINEDGAKMFTRFKYGESSNNISVSGGNNVDLEDIDPTGDGIISDDFTGDGNIDVLTYDKIARNNIKIVANLGVNNLIGFDQNFPNNVTDFDVPKFDEIVSGNILSSEGKVIPERAIVTIKDNPISFSSTISNVEFKAHTLNPNGHQFQYSKIWQAPKYRLDNISSCNSAQMYSTPKVYKSGDFNGDGLLDVLAFTIEHTEKWCEPSTDCGGNPQARVTDCCSCTDYSRDFTKSYFVDLNRNKTSNFSNYSGQMGFKIKSKSEAKNLIVTDYNGDGRSDILWLETGKITVYSLDPNNNLKQILVYSDSNLLPESKVITTGDFNGDGKLDFSTPEAENSSVWNFYIGTGITFEKFSDDIHIVYKKSEENSISRREYNYITQDFDNDGTSDFLVQDLHYSKLTKVSTENMSMYFNRRFINNTIRFYAPKTSYREIEGDITRGFPLLTRRRSSYGNGLYYYIRKGWSRTITSSNLHDKEIQLTEVNNGLYPGSVGHYNYGSIRQKIEYQQISEYGNSEYVPSNSLVYPFTNVNTAYGFSVVKKITEIASDFRSNKMERYRDFSYQGAMSHFTGLGFLGFEFMGTSNWYGDNVPKLWIYTKRSAEKRGAVLENFTSEYTEPTASLAFIHSKYEYISKILSNNIFVNVPDNTVTTDNLHGTTETKNFIYDSYYNPVNITTNDGSTTTTIIHTYLNNPSPTNSNYFIGRLETKNIISTIDSNTFRTFEEYNYSNNRIESFKEKGNGTPWVTETYVYDDWGNIIEKRLTGNGMTPRKETYKFTSNGKFLESYTNVEGLTTTYLTDKVGNVTKITDPYDNDTSFIYDAWNRIEVQTDYLSNKTKYIYEFMFDGSWQLTTDYDNAPDTIEITNAFGWTISSATLSIDNKWINTKYEYDVAGRIVKMSEPFFESATAWNEMIYDAYGRNIEQREYTGKLTTISYPGLSVLVNDGTMSSTTILNSSGLVSQKTDLGGTIKYKYHGNGTLHETELDGLKTIVEIDAWGRKTKLTDPSAGIYEYGYNLFGETTLEKTPKGNTTYIYDDFGRLDKTSIIGDETDLSLDYIYKNNGLLDKILGMDVANAENYTYTYGYDSYSRPISVKEVNSFASFEKNVNYDEYGRLNLETFSSINLLDGTRSIVNVRNNYESSSGVHVNILDNSNSSNLWQLNSINSRGNATKITMGNDFVSDAKYDSYGLPENITVSKDDGTAIEYALRMSYKFDAEKSRLNSRENTNLNWSESFKHDDLNRLTNVVGPLERNHEYDLLGRITDNNLLGAYGYDGNKKYQLASIDLTENGQEHFKNHVSQQITYNAFKKPVEITEENKGKVTLAYGPLSNRSHSWYGGKQDNKTERRYRKHYSAIMPAEIVEDTEENNVKIITYVGGDAYSAPIAHITTKNNDVNGFHYLHRDYLGSILAITDSRGNVKEQRQFGAWGTVDKFIDNQGGENFNHSSIIDRGYTGHEHFFEVSLIHMNGRMYDPVMGRFLSPDNFVQNPYHTQNYNRYSYVVNNPLIYNDPTGELFGSDGIFGTVLNFFGRLLGFAAPNQYGAGRLDSYNNWASAETAPTPNGHGQGPIPSNATPDGGLAGAWGNNNLIQEPKNDGFDITTGDVLRTGADFVPFVGSGLDIYEGIRDGDGWGVAAGVGFLILDVATLGSSSLVKGAFKTAGKGFIRSGKILGKAQRTGTRGHAFASKIVGLRYALDPRVKRVTYDLGYKKLLGGGSFKYGPRPDVGVLFKNGKVKAFEIGSKTDKLNKLRKRNEDFLKLNNIPHERVEVYDFARRLNRLLPKK